MHCTVVPSGKSASHAETSCSFSEFVWIVVNVEVSFKIVTKTDSNTDEGRRKEGDDDEDRGLESYFRSKALATIRRTIS